MFNKIVCQQRAGRTLRAIRGNNQEKALKALKSELAALDRKITAELAPKKEEQDGVENKQVNTVDTPATDTKKSMVAEPQFRYRPMTNPQRPIRLIGL